MKRKRILITGGAGSVGSELTRQLYKRNKIYILDIDETGTFDLCEDLGIPGRVGDIRNEKTVRDVFSDFRPQIVFHAAAYKHVTPMERFPEEACQTNIIGTLNVLHASKVYPVEKFIFISTDKAVDPNSIMGATKKVGEIMTKNKGKGYIAVRFGNVLGSRGSVIQIWQRQLAQGKPLTVTDASAERYFMTIEDAIDLVIQASKIGKGGETICLDMGKKVNILHLAKEIIKGLNGHPIENIGLRPGEILNEKLMTEEEEKRAIKQGKFWIIV